MLKASLVVLLIQAAQGFFPAQRQKATSNLDVNILEDTFTQIYDHFGTGGTFNQRFFYSNATASNSKVAFLFVGGDGEADSDLLTDTTLPFYNYSKNFGAHTFVLEHRYYGKSIPKEDYSSWNLGCFTAQQAVEDIPIFIAAMNKRFNLDADVKWILFGVSYSGSLAAWARQKYPDVITGAIASSAPLQATADFWQYTDQTELALKTIGSDACVTSIKDAFKQAVQLMNSVEGRATLSTTFGLVPALADTGLDYTDIQFFYFALQKEIMALVQQNNDQNGNIKLICNRMQATNASAINNLKTLLAEIMGQNVANFTLGYKGYNKVIAELRITNLTSEYAEERLWTWLTCSQLGFLTSTSNSENGLFGATVPFSYFASKCTDVFGPLFDANNLEDNAEYNNNWSGGAEGYTGTNVVFINGELDPWARLGKTSSLHFTQVVYTIPKAGHGQDFFQVNTNDTGVIRARELITINLSEWITGPPNPVKNVNATIPWVRDPFSGDSSFNVGESRFYPLGDDVPSKKTYPPMKSTHKRFQNGRPSSGFLPEPPAAERDTNSTITVGTFRQRWCHFNNKLPMTFQQKYWKNTEFAKPGGPNFLMIGGEGPGSERWVSNHNMTWLKYAATHGATVYYLEHRYYGDSKLGDNTALLFLSSRQMLYDLAEFIRAVNYETGTTAPWITFGGSYSGAMSLWMREVFPDLVAGAVGSSGPVQAKLNFFEYLQVVQKSIETYSLECASKIGTAFDGMHRLVLTPEGRKNLSDTFNLSPAWNESSVVTETDVHYFFSTIYGNFQGGVQYSGDNTGAYAKGYGIPEMCAIINNSTFSPLESVAAYNRYMTEFTNGASFNSTDNAYQDMIDDTKNAQNYGPAAGAGLLWTWQTCNEFGYYQSSDSAYSIFGSPAPVNMYIQMCQDVFPDANFSQSSIQEAVDYTNWKYGSRNQYRGTNVVAPNGSLDPWHALGTYVVSETVAPFLINGTAHCADMYPARDEDVPDLAIVRKLISDKIGEWIAAAPATTPVAPVTTPSAPESTTHSTSTRSLYSLCASLLISFALFH